MKRFFLKYFLVSVLFSITLFAGTCNLNTNLIKGGSLENSNDLNQWTKVSGAGHIVKANYATGWAGNAPSGAE